MRWGTDDAKNLRYDSGMSHLCKLIDVLHAALHCAPAHSSLLRITAEFNGVSFTCYGDIIMDFKDTDLPGSVTFSVSGPKDAKGKPAKLDGVPKWALDDSTNCQITSQAADGLSCVVQLSDNPSATQLTVTADADLGAGVTNLQSQAVINIVAGDAVSLGNVTASAITPGTGTGGGGTPALATSFPNRAAFDAAVLAFTGPEGVTIDGVNVGAGTPVLAYFTHSADGHIDMVGPTD